MQKYFYPIFKLPDEYEKDYHKQELPLWIKWWLLGKSGRELSSILTGSNFILENTIKRKFKIYEVGGNTEQAQYEGSNILPIDIQSQTKNGVTITRNEDGSITLNGTSNAWTNLSLCSNQEIEIASNTSCISRIETTGTKTGILYFSVYNVNAKINDISMPVNSTGITSNSYTATEDINITRANLEFASGVTFTNCNIKIWTNRGTTIDNFEPYVRRNTKPKPKVQTTNTQRSRNYCK